MAKEYDLKLRYSVDEVRDKFPHLFRLKDQELAQIEDKTDELVLVLHIDEYGQTEDHMGFRTNRRSLLNLAQQILRELDPSPEDRILATLQRIERLLEHQKDSES